MASQLVNDPDDPQLSTPEYEFLYNTYKGNWYRHIDQEDSVFGNVWEHIRGHDALVSFVHDTTPTVEQVYEIGEIHYRALWMKFTEYAEKIAGPPDVISWYAPMIPPTNTQRVLF